MSFRYGGLRPKRLKCHFSTARYDQNQLYSQIKCHFSTEKNDQNQKNVFLRHNSTNFLEVDYASPCSVKHKKLRISSPYIRTFVLFRFPILFITSLLKHSLVKLVRALLAYARHHTIYRLAFMISKSLSLSVRMLLVILNR